jgi:hypothetical protein
MSGFELSKADSKLADKLFAYEDGKLSEDEVIELFQSLVDNGWAWSLQGRYGRTAMDLIGAGLVSAKCQVFN